MKVSLLALLFSLSFLSLSAQRENFDVYGVETNPLGSPHALVTMDTLESAQSLQDLYARYRANWVKEYLSVELTVACEGETQVIKSQNDQLSSEQLALLMSADENCQVNFAIDYIPENKLKHNPARQMEFGLRIRPYYEAKYPSGMGALRQYIKSQIVDQISAEDFEQIALATIRFRIDENGQVAKVKIANTSGNNLVDQLIHTKVTAMPTWTPAYSSSHQAIPQDFEMLIGTSLLSCSFQH